MPKPPSPIAWAFFLAVSWTWCIGMYLPTLLLRDFGWGGYLAFLLPNCIGAALMGTMLSGAQSRALVARHALAVRTFSLVTVCFQAFFGLWLIAAFAREPSTLPVFSLPLLGVAVLVIVLDSSYQSRTLTLLAKALWVASVALAAYGATNNPAVSFSTAAEATTSPPLASLHGDLIFLVPICTFGFALCPYLDGTFHAALQGAEREGEGRTAGGGAPGRRLAFGVGFLVLFAVMVLITPLYAGLVAGKGPGGLAAAPALAVHIVLQLAYTIAVHVRGVFESTKSGSEFDDAGAGGPSADENEFQRRQLSLPGTVAGIALLLASALVGIVAERLTHADLPAFLRESGLLASRLAPAEIIYRCFMAFYGLILPAYVYLCIVPWRGFAGPSRQNLTVFAIATLLALPGFAAGFLGDQMRFGVLGLCVVLMAKLFAQRGPRRGDGVSAAA